MWRLYCSTIDVWRRSGQCVSGCGVADDQVAPADWAALTVQERYRSSVGGSATTRQAAVIRPFRTRLVMSDGLLIAAAMGLGLLVSSRQSQWRIDPLLAIYGTPVMIGLLWMGLLVLTGAYDQRYIGVGTEEVRRAITATLYTFAAVAGLSYLVRADISRSYAFVSLPLGLLAICIARVVWRRWLYRRRYEGQFLVRTVLVGQPSAVEPLAGRLTQDAFAGYEVAGLVASEPAGPADIEPWLAAVDEVLAATGATAVAIALSHGDANDSVRQLAWRLEGRGVDLLIAPGALDLAGPRLSMRPAAGLPLLHLDEAVLSRPQRFAKRTLDLVGSSVAIIVLSPVLLACAIAVRTTSPGPVIFRQPRIGRAGRTFTMLKFRSMRAGADAERAGLRAQHDHDDPMFKLAQDPRITGAGRVLRRWSLDELPQLFNVLGGSMSLVGPRPHPMDDVDRYGIEAFRRLALKPGMTGLWQVEGRSDLTWQEALQLDLYYVERWSLATDVVLLARTVRAVLQGRGAV
jgi:exopolysaccharide biosynthesis polyprenyl glycosylphosphotransferase